MECDFYPTVCEEVETAKISGLPACGIGAPCAPFFLNNITSNVTMFFMLEEHTTSPTTSPIDKKSLNLYTLVAEFNENPNNNPPIFCQPLTNETTPLFEVNVQPYLCGLYSNTINNYEMVLSCSLEVKNSSCVGGQLALNFELVTEIKSNRTCQDIQIGLERAYNESSFINVIEEHVFNVSKVQSTDSTFSCAISALPTDSPTNSPTTSPTTSPTAR